ncbi:MAG: hypothetical protein R3D98_08110 [Candidatus Krumholzibacteriia bacterium]
MPPPLPETPARPTLDRDLVLWPADDPEAGELADRLASLAARPLLGDQPNVGRGPLTPPPLGGEAARPGALAVPAASLTAHLQRARVGAVLLPWPRRFPRAEDELSRLLSLADWLVAAADDPTVDPFATPPGARPARPRLESDAMAAMRRLERAGVVQPLVRTRAVVVSRPAVTGWSWLLDGTLRLWDLTRQD